MSALRLSAGRNVQYVAALALALAGHAARSAALAEIWASAFPRIQSSSSSICRLSALKLLSRRFDVKGKDEVCFLRCEGRFVALMDPEYLLNWKNVLADFSKVSDVGSARIGFIVGVYTSTRDLGGRFIMVGLRARVREVFSVTGVSTVIPWVADIASGLAMLHYPNVQT